MKNIKTKLTHVLTSPTRNGGHFISDLPCRQATEHLLAINRSGEFVSEIELVASLRWASCFSCTADSRTIRPYDRRINSNVLSDRTKKKNTEVTLTFLDQVLCPAVQVHRTRSDCSCTPFCVVISWHNISCVIPGSLESILTMIRNEKYLTKLCMLSLQTSSEELNLLSLASQ